MKAKWNKVKIEVERPFCPKCGAEIDKVNPGHYPYYQTMSKSKSGKYEDDRYAGGEAMKCECPCSIWVRVMSHMVDKRSSYVRVGGKDEQA